MGLDHSKHIHFSNAEDRKSSKEFALQRKLHYKSEFSVAKHSSDVDTYEQLSDTEREITTHFKKTTFLELPKQFSDESKDIFRQKSLKSEVNEFTFAKEMNQKKKKTYSSKIDISDDRDRKSRKGKKKSTKASRIRNHSHEPY
jgi:hypothetical protein